MSIYGSSLNVPYISLVTKLRMSKRQSETEMAQILKQIINLKNSADTKTKQYVLEQLRHSRERLTSLKDKLRVQKKHQDQIYSVCRKRVHLDQEANGKKKQYSKQQLFQEFDKEVIQFFACRNKLKQARSIQKSLQDNYYFELYVQLYEKAFNISEAIGNNDLRPLKDWCYEHSHYLTKIKSSLEFKLISCSFVNILNNKNGVKAIDFLRKEVATLTLSEQDKQEINKLAFMIIMAERQSDYEYYSDSQKQKEMASKISNSLQSLSLSASMLKQKQKGEEQPADREELSRSSSSQSVREALVAAQQNMRSIYRAIVGLAEDAQDLVSRAIGSVRPIGNSTEQNIMINVQSLTPHVLLHAEPELMHQNYDEMYEDKFDSMSDELEEHKVSNNNVKQAKQDPDQNEKTKQNELKLDEEKDRKKQIMKQVKRKHKLDKNNLRTLLKQTKREFLSSFSKIYQLPFVSYFDKTLAVGMSLLKTSSCTQTHCFGLGSASKLNCPICSTEIQRIVKNIPGTLKNQSSLICRINGTLMNEVNYPVVLPNGQVYSISGLKIGQKNGKYHCIIQGKWFRKQACRKVFLT